MEAWGRQARKAEPPRAQIGGDERSLGHLRRLPDRQRRRSALQGVSVGVLGKPAPRIAGDNQSPPGRLPQAARLKYGDQITLVAAGMTAHQRLAVFARTDRKARAPVIMRRAAGPSMLPLRGARRGPWRWFQRSWRTSPSFGSAGAAASSLAAAGLSARDHSASMPKKPVTLRMIWRASSWVRSRPMRGCQTCPLRAKLLASVIVVCGVETFHRRPHGRFRRSVLLVSGLGFPPMTLDPKGFASSGVPVSGIADRSHALGRFSGAPRFRG